MRATFAARWRTVVVVLGAAALATVGACFTPQEPACAFSCVTPPNSCPAEYTCDQKDGLCHNPKSKAACSISPVVDGGADGAAE